jgi:hypothetical protein
MNMTRMLQKKQFAMRRTNNGAKVINTSFGKYPL